MKHRYIKAFVAAICFAAVAQSSLAWEGYLRQSTSRVVRLCGFVAVGDGFTPVTTVNLGTADEAEALRENTATLDISGATWAAITGADGCYSLTLDTTATNTVGELKVIVQDDSLILPERFSWTVVEEAVYDRDFAASATGIVGTAQTGDSYARLGAPAGASVSADIAALLAQVANSKFGIIEAGTAQAGATGNIQLAASVSRADNFLNCATVALTGGTGAGQSRVIGTWTSATDTGTVTVNWTTAPSSDTTYLVFQTSCQTGVDVLTIEGTDATDQLDAHAAAGLDAAGVRSALGMAAATYDTDIAALSTAAEIRAEMDSNSTQMAAIVADTNEMQGDLTNGGRLDLIFDAVKAVTDQFVFTNTGEVDANVKSMNDAEVLGNGTSGNQWRGQ